MSDQLSRQLVYWHRKKEWIEGEQKVAVVALKVRLLVECPLFGDATKHFTQNKDHIEL